MRAYAGTRVASCTKYKRDKFVRPYVGYENMRTGEIQWYNQGIYLVNNPQWSYNASTNEISMQALDLMSKLTGLRNGNLEGVPTKIAKDENVREAIIKTIELGGFTKYICEECKTNDGTIVPVPYDIEIDVGGTVYDILTGLRDIMPNYQIYFDINGVFHYEPIPLAYDDPVLIDDDLFNNVLISENINTDFESVKNYVEVLGHTWDVDYYSPSESTTVSGGTITPTFADLKELQNDTAVGITLPSDITNVDKITINFLGSNDVVDIDDEPVKELSKDTEWIFQCVAGEKGKLPSTYRKLEYIQSSGKQYIDTGVIVKDITEIKVDFQAVTILSGENQYASSWVDYSNHIQIGISGNTFIDSGGVTYSQTSSVTARTQAVGVPLGAVNLHLYLFAQSEGTGALHYSSGRIFSCQITTADGLVRNFVPCKNPDGVIGMYDVVNDKFYQNSGSDTFIAGTDLGPGDGALPFWRFMGHQQAQATSYDNNPSSPFYVGDPIGSSSVGRIRIVLSGGEYDNIYSDDLAQQRADFEIYQRSRLKDSI